MQSPYEHAPDFAGGHPTGDSDSGIIGQDGSSESEAQGSDHDVNANADHSYYDAVDGGDRYLATDVSSHDTEHSYYDATSGHEGVHETSHQGTSSDHNDHLSNHHGETAEWHAAQGIPDGDRNISQADNESTTGVESREDTDGQSSHPPAEVQQHAADVLKCVENNEIWIVLGAAGSALGVAKAGPAAAAASAVVGGALTAAGVLGNCLATEASSLGR
jgi:hypothetical protein